MDKYEQNLARQLEMNAATWEQLQAHGVTPGTKLVLDFSFDAVGSQNSSSGQRGSR